ncbi:MAG: PAS domain S-box protein [Deltaproteobacteria bacterium]|nr:PAS domain S-box protein [Deltaproteobacteria bacterium]MBN2670410.1 PAS domain S-box protein [Deltaproteobacteria bacterium]
MSPVLEISFFAPFIDQFNQPCIVHSLNTGTIVASNQTAKHRFREHLNNSNFYEWLVPQSRQKYIDFIRELADSTPRQFPSRLVFISDNISPIQMTAQKYVEDSKSYIVLVSPANNAENENSDADVNGHPSSATTQSAHHADDYVSLFNSMLNGFAVHEIICNPQGKPVNYRFLDINPAFEKITGLRRDIIGKTVLEVLPNTEPIWIEKYGEVALTGEPIQFSQFSGELGKYFTVTAYSPAPKRFVVVFEDITARKNAEEEQRRLYSAIEHAAEMCVITNADGDIQYTNPAFEEITGYKKAELLGQNPRVLRSGRHDPVFYDSLWQTISSGRTWRGTFINKKKDGTLYTEQAVISPITNDDGKIVNYVAVKRDITAEIQREEQLRQAEKMEALGHLAGGIAHDFNNVLGAIIGYTELLEETVKPSTTQATYIKNVLSAGERARQLVGQILSFSRQHSAEKTTVFMGSIVREVYMLIRACFPSSVEIQADISSNPIPVLANPTQLHEVIMNLCTNAMQAMNETGMLKLDFNEVAVDTPISGYFGNIPEGKYARLIIEDNGCGMTEETMSKMFEQFFTTKPVGQGTGMGLAVAQEIVKQHDGNLIVRSIDGVGTVITLYIPISDSLISIAAEPMVPKLSNREAARILFVDDEITLTYLASQMIADMGFLVDSTSSSMKALQMFEKSADRYDLVITDHKMPDLNGIELARRIHSVRPSIPILLCTGLGDDERSNSFGPPDIQGVLAKPFRKKVLEERIRSLITP